MTTHSPFIVECAVIMLVSLKPLVLTQLVDVLAEA